MASIIENSIKEYQHYLDGNDNDVKVIERTIPVKPEYAKRKHQTEK